MKYRFHQKLTQKGKYDIIIQTKFYANFPFLTVSRASKFIFIDFFLTYPLFLFEKSYLSTADFSKTEFYIWFLNELVPIQFLWPHFKFNFILLFRVSDEKLFLGMFTVLFESRRRRTRSWVTNIPITWHP
jgi:hypothetical protein